MKRTLMISVMTLLLCGCLDKFNPPTSTADLNYLVVSGIVNGDGITTIELTRTRPITAPDIPDVETGALVQIESENGTIYTLTEAGPSGQYNASTAGLDRTTRYRLKIKTGDQREYMSDFVPVKDAPEIDTITYTVKGQDFQLYVSTHDETDKTRFYFWKYVETWAYNSRYASTYTFDRGFMTLRPNAYEIYNCFSTLGSNNILLASSAKLQHDIIHDFPLLRLDLHSEKLQTKYSVLIEQFALTEDAYEYWLQLKKSTESVGSIFDPQPSQSVTNIRCVTNPHEPVVGFFSAGVSKTKRFFVSKDDLPKVIHDTGYEGCILDTLKVADVQQFDGNELVVDAVSDMRGVILYYTLSTYYCVDCRFHGGTLEVPPFWQ